MSESEEFEIVFDRLFRNYCLAVLRHDALDIYRSEKRDKKCFVSFEAVANAPKYLTYLAYSEKFDAKDGIRQIFTVLDVNIEFYDDYLVQALNFLSAEQRQIVLLYYCLNKSDKSICDILGKKNRSTVQYQRQSAINLLRAYMNEFHKMEEEK